MLLLRNRFAEVAEEDKVKPKPKHKSIRVQFAALLFDIHDFIKNKSRKLFKRTNKLQYLQTIKKKLNDSATDLIVTLMPLNITIKK